MKAKILVVTDHFLNYRREGQKWSGSSLTPALSRTKAAFKKWCGGDVSFAKAYYKTPGKPGPNSADIQISTGGLDDDLLADYDQLWLFGRDFSDCYLQANEIEAIENRRKEGMGIFATGDHHQFGNGLCGDIEKVGLMRSWSKPKLRQSLHPEPLPAIDTEHRVDTSRPLHLRSDPNAGDIDRELALPPKEIFPLYVRRADGASSKPHPLMSRGKNPIRSLPDHGHEGVCLELDPGDPVVRSQFDNHLPYIVAWSVTTPGRRTAGHTVERVRKYGCVSKFEGFGEGSIVVDSTFHHWIADNIIPVFSAGGADALDLERYYLNILLALLPETKASTLLPCLVSTVRNNSIVQEHLDEFRGNKLDVDRQLLAGKMIFDTLIDHSSEHMVENLVDGFICETCNDFGKRYNAFLQHQSRFGDPLSNSLRYLTTLELAKSGARRGRKQKIVSLVSEWWKQSAQPFSDCVKTLDPAFNPPSDSPSG